MIYEVRTYTLKPGTVPQAEQAFADKIAERVKYSPLAGFWRSEVGTLNQIIHIWPYKDIAERDRIREDLRKAEEADGQYRSRLQRLEASPEGADQVEPFRRFVAQFEEEAVEPLRQDLEDAEANLEIGRAHV